MPAGHVNSSCRCPAGFTYTWNAANPVGSRVDPATITLNGVPIDPAASYRVTMNNFLGAGGDDFPALRQGTNETTGDDDLVALVEYLGCQRPVHAGRDAPHHARSRSGGAQIPGRA